MVSNDVETALRALRAYVRAVALAEPLQRELAARHGVSVADLIALRRLQDLGEAPISRFALAVGLSASATTDLADRLEGAGLLERTAHPTDRRITLVSLSPAGTAALSDTAIFRESSVMHAIEQLSRADQDRLAALLEQLVGAMAAGARETVEVGE